MIRPVLLDTDILSAIMRRHPQTLHHAQQYLSEHRQLTFSVITRYEILKGLKAKNAAVQVQNFSRFCEISRIIPLQDEIFVRAAQIYADLRQKGISVGDADILIAASALQHRLVLVSNNEKHFRHIEKLELCNWMKQAADNLPIADSADCLNRKI